VVGIYPNDAALVRLAGALLIEQDEWLVSRRSLSEESLQAVLTKAVTAGWGRGGDRATGCEHSHMRGNESLSSTPLVRQCELLTPYAGGCRTTLPSCEDVHMRAAGRRSLGARSVTDGEPLSRPAHGTVLALL